MCMGVLLFVFYDVSQHATPPSLLISPPLEVCRYLTTDRGDAKALASIEDTKKASAEHQSRARNWLKRSRGAAPAGDKQRKMHRNKSYEWCATLDNALRVATGLYGRYANTTDKSVVLSPIAGVLYLL